MNSQNKISFYVITKNEEKNIKRCLKSIKNVADEIVVVDSGSSDHTVSIAKNFGARVFKIKFNDSLSELRNFALSKTRYDWVLTLDSDEVLSPQLQQIIPKIIRQYNCSGFWFTRRHYITPQKYLKHGYFYPDYQLRLFRNKKNLSYAGRLHEKLNIPKQDTCYLPYHIDHFARNPKYNSLWTIFKIGWYVKLQAKEYLNQKMSVLSFLLMGLWSFPYHFIGSFIRGQGFRDGWFGFVGAMVFSYSISAAYLYAIYLKLASNNDIVSNK